jgi:Ala-tRNA(Pro) deacylase
VAASVHIPGRDLAKVIVVLIDGKLALAVVPASRQVDMDLLRAAADGQFAELAEERDFVNRFEGCQLGAMPPFGNLFGMETYVEKEMAKEEYIAFNAGSHTDVIALRFSDYRRVAHPKLANIATAPAGQFAMHA